MSDRNSEVVTAGEVTIQTYVDGSEPDVVLLPACPGGDNAGVKVADPAGAHGRATSAAAGITAGRRGRVAGAETQAGAARQTGVVGCLPATLKPEIE
jgi:hypothetical protein